MEIEEVIQIGDEKTFTTYKTEFNGVRSTLIETRNHADDTLVYEAKTYDKDQYVTHTESVAERKFKHVQTELIGRNPNMRDFLTGDTTALSIKEALHLEQ